ncbi:hypothetical protein NA57DRAFT_62889 [Rhizodiscina lignyota]|uniref:Polysaccharide pyruvyl transferase domain-containing protein n=1 Tax=Rhizodiscina lignyota TaxID=1504668 RepID=A0A9P4IU08_9PEZI|nr:hypothetical protein NA57DRAFT_62889 [Rhizodiscina lignyota]
MGAWANRPLGRIAVGAFILLWIIFAFAFLGGRYSDQEWYSQSVDRFKAWTSSNYTEVLESAQQEIEDENIAPKVGCEVLVSDLQLRLLEEYSQLLKGIRHVNIWGYLETENKGDAAIWAAQQMLLSEMGIESHESCRFLDKGCNAEQFRAALEHYKPHSAVVMAGGGNFNDYYWEDQPSRINMINNFPDVPIRAFPQSIHMTKADRINATRESFGKHPDLQVAARDQPSYDWLRDNLGQKVLGDGKEVKSVLVPDIAFMWGNRPDFRRNTKKTHDILILARDDKEISAGGSKQIPFGTGVLDLGGRIGNVTYQKVDWKFTHTPGIDRELPEFVDQDEPGKNQRAWAKAVAGFELLGSAKFVITDRLHGHIMSTIIGVPHVLMDSKLGKNLNFHDTWTQDCECTRITDDFEKSLEVARLYFESIDDGLQ